MANDDLGGVLPVPEHRRDDWMSLRVPRITTGQAPLRAAVTLWFLVTTSGQWLFVAYIFSLYGGAVVHGHLDRWGKFLTHGLIQGDHVGNVALALHLALAALITAGGPLQLVPQIRAHAPVFHRWLGRAYMVTALVISISALYLVWIRNAGLGSVVQASGISVDALLIIACGWIALRHAVGRRFAAHRQWAIRLFLVVSGVWFFRVGLFFSLVVNHGPFGFNEDSFEGPFLNFLSFAESLFPLTVFELYLRTQSRARATERLVMAAGLLCLTVATAIGVSGVFMSVWLPNL